MLKIVRWFVGRLVLFFNWASMPAEPKYSVDEQVVIDEAAKNLQLYEFRACPFCVKVRRELRRLGVSIETRDASRVAEYREQLVEGGGQYKVPCLRINEGEQSVWLYESNDIIVYLREKFSPSAKSASAS